MDTSSVVKAVRLDNETIQRITAHMVRLQALWGPAVWVNEGMALRDVILKGLDVAEGAAQQAPEAPIPATAPIAVEEVEDVSKLWICYPLGVRENHQHA